MKDLTMTAQHCYYYHYNWCWYYYRHLSNGTCTVQMSIHILVHLQINRLYQRRKMDIQVIDRIYRCHHCVQYEFLDSLQWDRCCYRCRFCNDSIPLSKRTNESIFHCWMRRVEVSFLFLSLKKITSSCYHFIYINIYGNKTIML